LNTLNECRRAIGGAAFFIGQIGGGNGYIESVPVIRPDIDAFMTAAGTGGPANVVGGPAVMFAKVTAVRDRSGQIVKLYASGPLFETPRGLVQGIASRTRKSETWRLEGWRPERAETLDGKRCWLSGERVLVYDEKGNLVDYYFALHRTLMRAEFDSVLNFAKGIALRGGL